MYYIYDDYDRNEPYVTDQEIDFEELAAMDRIYLGAVKTPEEGYQLATKYYQLKFKDFAKQTYDKIIKEQKRGFYIYNNHVDNSPYISRHELDIDDLICETCGGYDELIGVVKSARRGYDLTYDYYKDEEKAHEVHSYIKGELSLIHR